ncbi:MAG: hypothetical protein QME79_01995 [Bacillota bacterium]|nr:hypothetical protein [Bacillota bacterium]
MKGISVALMFALAFTAVAPAMAAPAVVLTGDLETRFTARKGSVINESFLTLQAGLQGGAEKTKAVVILAPWVKPDPFYTQKWVDPADPSKGTTEEFIPSNATRVTFADPMEIPGNPVGESFESGSIFTQGFANMIRAMYLQTTGAFWNGGPEATTTIGTIGIMESPFVGDLGSRRGIKVEGLKLGPLGVEAFYAPAGGFSRTFYFNEDYQNPQTRVKNVDSVTGTQLTARFSRLSLGANIVRSVVTGEEKPEMAFTAAWSPGANLALDGYVIRDRNEKHVVRVNGAYGVNPNLTLTASYRQADEEINPLYPTRYDANGDGFLTTDEWVDSVNNRKFAAFDNRTGPAVGADLRVAGVHVNGSYDWATTSTDPNHVARMAADTTLAGFKLRGAVKYVGGDLDRAQWGAERDFDLAGLKVRSAYTGERYSDQVVSHEVRAATTLDLLQPVKGLTLDARYKVFEEPEGMAELVDEFEANARYRAPNGMTFGIRHLVDAAHPDGDLAFTSGLRVVF